ncbi:MAG: hypothetical protein M3Y87_15555, partial [Myxococcota bacterium]|nr:hypothetical protein [Myxococcota bacterium]
MVSILAHTSRMRVAWLALAALFVLAPTVSARAQLTRRGESIVVSDVGPTKRLPALAFDPVNGRWLVVWSLHPVAGRFLDRDGTPLGDPFVVPSRSPEGSIAPRVVHAPGIDAFLVTWLAEESGSSRVSARLVRANADGTPSFVSGDVSVSETARAKHPESSPSAAWSEASRTFVVTWADTEGDLDVRARRLDAAAVPLGDEVLVSSGEAFDAFPVVSVSPVGDTFLIAWTYEPVTGGGSIATRRMTASDGALGEEHVLYASTFENYPDLAYDARRDRFFVVSWHIGPGEHDVWGRFADTSGAPIGEVIPVAASAGFEGGDGIGVAYNREADAYTVVYQTDDLDVWGSAMTGDGMPGASFEITTGARMGSYAPRVAAEDGAPRFLVVASLDFDRIVAQGLDAPAVALPDAG